MTKTNRPPFLHPANWISTWFGAGYLRPASGTWGTLAALPFAWAIGQSFGQTGLFIMALMAYGVGIWSSGLYSQMTQSHDASEVVIDEVAGIWLTLAAIPLSLSSLVVGFFLFRIMDIVKPFPANMADKRLPGGIGIMTDDMIAGLYAGIALYYINDYGWLPYV
ncbi:phosphatidylglycerophosphatase A family protein [Aestuariispira insulae]|uniref:Phosphatidylglycerophosphatase A n=1 Tax=Aestuariispira insulae TaxID=1461337 RepID=A0A3D9HUZ3_9PROT|nr:phosphatidylglycerophosphatase A [Aestuariispira insulae]RED53259.1 phosphatidylglycerophosphatase [Aestuariispira insulae]